MLIVFLPVARRPAPGVVRRVGEPRWQRAGRSGATSAARSSRRASWARCCSCSRTRSRPTRRPPRWSARAARSSRSRSPARCPERGRPGPGERGQGPGARDDRRRLGRDARLRVHPATRVAVGPMTTSTRTSLGAAAPEGGALLIAQGRGRAAARREARRWPAHRVLIVLGYLVLPLFAMLEFSTRGDFGRPTLSFAGSPIVRRTRTSSTGIITSLADRRPDGLRDAAAARADHGLDRSPRRRAMRRVVEFLCLLPLAIPAIVLVVGHRADLPVDGPEPRRARGVALTLAFIDIILVLPYAYRAIDCRPAVHRRRDARRRGAQPGRRLAADDLPGHRPEHPRRHPVGLGPRDRPRARRVHDLVAALVRHAPGRHLPARQARSVRLGRGLAGRPGLRVRPAVRHHPLRARRRRARPSEPPKELA